LSTLALGTPACGQGALCDAKSLNAAMMKGGIVEVGECTVSGSLDVPAGVTLRGRSQERSIILGSMGQAAVLVHADGAATRIADLKVESRGPAGVLARGTGELALSDVSVQTAIGIGVGIENVETLDLSALVIAGPVTSANAVSIPNGVTPSESGTHGLVLLNIGKGTLENVSISGFASIGALIVDSTVTWQTGSASDNLALGLDVDGGDATLKSLSICRTLQGGLLLPSFAAVFTSSASVSADGLQICDGQGYGALIDGGSGVFTNFSATGNGNAALWAQDTNRLEVAGQLRDNRFAGIVLVDARSTLVHDATIDSTRKLTHIFHDGGMPVEVGDGVQIVRSGDSTTLRDVTMNGNQRTGVLVELGGGTAMPQTFDHVTVTVSDGTQHAVVAQDGSTPPGWDDGVMRVGTNEVLDQSVAGRLNFVQAVGPCDMPKPDDLRAGGLASLTGL
jgi:hypothetical protein